MNSQELISIYGKVADLTDQMVSAAENNDWTLLAQLERHCSAQVQVLRDNEGPIKCKEDEQQKKIYVIHHILAGDTKIRAMTKARMDQLTLLMKKNSTQNKLARAYALDNRRYR